MVSEPGLDQREYYRELFHRYGDSPKAMQWTDRDSQIHRLAVLLVIIDNALNSDTRILDFGCGTGALQEFLQQLRIRTKYTGVDIVPEFLAAGAAKFPDDRFCFQDEIAEETFDYIFISGTFNVNDGRNEQFIADTLRWCFDRVEPSNNLGSKGIAFNLLSTYVDYQSPDLFYKSPESIVQFIKSEFGSSCRFSLRNDYSLISGVDIPTEYSVFIYR